MSLFIAPEANYASVLTAFMPQAQGDRVRKQLDGARRFNLAMREPGWIDQDPPTWEWNR